MSAVAQQIVGGGMLILAGTSYKGGVGKTTYNSGFACAIKKIYPKMRVLFIDSTEMQGSRSLRFAPKLEMDGRGLGLVLFTAFGAVSKESTVEDMGLPFERAVEQAAQYLRESLVEVQIDPLDEDSVIYFLPAAGSLLQEVMDDRWREPRMGYVLEMVLRKIEADFDICVFDVSPNIKSRTTNAVLQLANAVISIFDVRTIDTLVGFDLYLNEIQKSGVKHVGGIANMYEKKWADSREALKTLHTVADQFNLPLWDIPLCATVINTLRCVELENGRMSSGIYTQMAMDRSQSENLRKVADKLEMITRTIVGPLISEKEEEGAINANSN